MKPVDKPLRMLISFAHPDDESFGMGGAIAKYVQSGVEVCLICSTNGDVGTVDDEYMEKYDSIAALRLDELRCAAETLGIKEVITFGYRDSGMMGTPDNDHPNALWQADEDVVTERIVREIRRLKPQVVVTFDAYGGYGHPDHIYMHRATSRAFHAAADPAQFPQHLDEGLEPHQPAKLFYNTFPRAMLRVSILRARLSGQDPRRIGKNNDIDLVDIASRREPAHARIKVSDFNETWQAASNCHASQLTLATRPQQSWLNRLVRLLFQHQLFTRAYPAPNGHEPMEDDLFAGLR